MKKNKKKSLDIEKYKRLDGTYHLEDEQLSENELKKLFKLLTSEDSIEVQRIKVGEVTLDN